MNESEKKIDPRRRTHYIKEAIFSHERDGCNIWYINDEDYEEKPGDEFGDGIIAAASTREMDDKIIINNLGSLGSFKGLQVLKAIAEYALQKNLKVILYSVLTSIPYYEEIGFKQLEGSFTGILTIDPKELLERPDYFPDKVE